MHSFTGRRLFFLLLILSLAVSPAAIAQQQAPSTFSLPDDPFASEAIGSRSGDALPGDSFAAGQPADSSDRGVKGDPFGSGGDPFADDQAFSGHSQAEERLTEAEPEPFTVDLHGYLETRNRLRTRDGKALSTRQRLWLESEAGYTPDWAEQIEAPFRFFASAALDLDPAAADLSDDHDLLRPHLEEAFATLDTTSLDIVLGRKMLRWGTGDGVNPLDLINPLDHRDPVASGRADSRVPVVLGQAMVRLPTWGLVQEASLEGVVVPLAQVNELNAAGSAWESRALKTLRLAAQKGLLILKDQQEPDQPLEDAEFGLRLAATFSGWDLALIGFHGFVDSPVLRRQEAVNALGEDIYQLTPVHPRFWAVGVNFAKGLDRSTIRGELALKPDMPMTLADDASIPGYERRALLEGVLGWDRTFGLNLYLNLQYFYTWVSDPEGLSQDEFTHGLTCDLHDMFMEDALEAGMRGTVSFSDQGWVGELYAEYTPVDDWLFTASLMVFEGPESGQYGQYDQNDSLTLSLRYSF